MNQLALAIGGIIYSLLIMTLVVRRWGTGASEGNKTSMQEVFWVATLWGVTAGIEVVINPMQVIWNPPIPLALKIMHWLLSFLLGLAGIRTFFGMRPASRKILTVLLGLIFIVIAHYVLLALGPWPL